MCATLAAAVAAAHAASAQSATLARGRVSGRESTDPEIKREALLCVQKMMVAN